MTCKSVYIIVVILIPNTMTFSYGNINGLEQITSQHVNADKQEGFEPTEELETNTVLQPKGFEFEGIPTWLGDTDLPADSVETNVDDVATRNARRMGHSGGMALYEGDVRDTGVTGPRPLARVRREFITDNGYGSRLQAGSNLARSMSAFRDVFGDYGPGKRKRGESGATLSWIIDNTDGNDDAGLALSKRFMSDNGYGSRIQAGSSIANSLRTRDNVFGRGGPGKRAGYAQTYILPRYDHDVDNTDGNDDAGLALSKRFMSDNGYGSRIQAGSSIANSLRTRDNVFGRGGPGKRAGYAQTYILPRYDHDYGIRRAGRFLDSVKRSYLGVIPGSALANQLPTNDVPMHYGVGPGLGYPAVRAVSAGGGEGGMVKRYMPILDNGFGSRIQTAADIQARSQRL